MFLTQPCCDCAVPRGFHLIALVHWTVDRRLKAASAIKAKPVIDSGLPALPPMVQFGWSMVLTGLLCGSRTYVVSTSHDLFRA